MAWVDLKIIMFRSSHAMFAYISPPPRRPGSRRSRPCTIIIITIGFIVAISIIISSSSSSSRIMISIINIIIIIIEGRVLVLLRPSIAAPALRARRNVTVSIILL